MTPEERTQLEAARAAGEAAAARLTEKERARRFRAAMLLVVEQLVPPAFQRLPRAEVARLSDARCVELAESVLGLLLAPGEVA